MLIIDEMELFSPLHFDDKHLEMVESDDQIIFSCMCFNCCKW